MDYIINFSWKGLLVFTLAMLPNICYFKNLKKEAIRPQSSHKILDILEHTSQAIFVLLLIFVTSKKESLINSPFVFSITVLLLLYYILWVLYMKEKRNMFIINGLAVVPVLYFLVSEYWLFNYPAMIPTIVFGIFHTIITSIDYKTHNII